MESTEIAVPSKSPQVDGFKDTDRNSKMQKFSVAGFSTFNNHVLYHVYTLWLFNVSDLENSVYPHMAFSFFNYTSGLIIDSSTAVTKAPSAQALILRLSVVVIWLWLHLLVATLSNQRLETSIFEDALNKPWRPIPSKRITPESTRRLLIVTVLLSSMLSYVLHVYSTSLTIMTLIWLYNDIGVADDHWILRNTINSAAILSWGAGATWILIEERDAKLTPKGMKWFTLLFCIMATTLQAQDLRDIEGDKAKGRQTLPIAWSPKVTRWSAAGFIILWSIFAPMLWDCRFLGFSVVIGWGVGLAGHLTWTEGQRNSKISFTGWCVWMILLFALPIM
jgi:4-hydroxybenzoate polyprenyltransferase